MTEHWIDLIIRSSDEAIDTSIRIPLDSTPEQRQAMVKVWIEAIIGAMQIPAPSPSKLKCPLRGR